ncbi:MAG: hypothetical protein LBL36_00065 [Clostridiales Family XIII bacterium]|jgi:hypothetical protein|nr:hypothetical protein [Clostridiales Family XIII bacterium]
MSRKNNKVFTKLIAIMVAIIVVFGMSFVAPPEEVYADSTPTMEEIEAELYTLESKLGTGEFGGSEPSQTQDAKVFDLIKDYSAAHPGDKTAYYAYLNTYANQRAWAQGMLDRGGSALFLESARKILERVEALQIVAESQVVADLCFTVDVDTARKEVFIAPKPDGGMDVATATVKVWNDTTQTETTKTFAELAYGYGSAILKSGYHWTVTIAFTEPDLGPLTYTKVNPGWDLQANGKWKYYEKAPAGFNDPVTTPWEWREIGGVRYYFNDTGIMQTGWLNVMGYYNESTWKLGWYYFASNGAYTGWHKLSNKWHYFNSLGRMQSGWQKLSNQWYYLSSADSGVMVTGWKQLSGKWYYFGGASDGKMKTGWQTINGKRYYFGSSGDGAMKTGTVKISGKTYRFAASGALVG